MSKQRSYKRGGGAFRDITTFVIATEGAKREVRYFEALAANQRRIQVKVLGAGTDNRSAPNQTMQRAIDYTSIDNSLLEGDQVWLVVDTDRWTQAQLMEVERACRDKGWFLTISNPCFELWLYLHYAELPEDFTGSCQDLKYALGQITLPRGYTPETALMNLPEAIRRSEALDTNPDLRLPPTYVTQVHRLVSAMRAFME